MPAIAALLRKSVFDVSTRRYVDLDTGTKLDDRTFSDKHFHLTEDQSPHAVLRSNKKTRKVDKIDYIPRVADLFVTTSNGEEAYNDWRPSDLQPSNELPTLIFEHLAYLIPDDDSRNHVLDCLAYLVQFPSGKLRHAVLIIGKQGTGKTIFFVELLNLLVGKHNLRWVQSEALLSEWTAGFGNCQVMVIEKLMAFGRLEVYNRRPGFPRKNSRPTRSS